MSEQLRVSLNSISCVEKGPSLLSPQYFTEQTLSRAHELHQKLAPIFGAERTGVSLHLGRMLNVAEAMQLCREFNLPVSSLDVPQTVTVGSEIIGFFKDIHKAAPKKGLAGALKQEIFRLPNRAGWYLTNVGSFEARDEKLNEGLPLLTAFNTAHYIICTTMADFIGSSRGEDLRNKLAIYQNVILAVSMDPYHETPAEYTEKLLNIARVNGRTTPVYADINLGKLGLSKNEFGNKSLIPEPLQIYEKFLENAKTRALLAITTFDQYTPGDQETHQKLIDGPIDLLAAARELGKRSENNELPLLPMASFAFNPGLYDLVISSAGISFMQKFHDSFEGK